MDTPERARSVDNPHRPAAVYRLYDAAGDLLYVGVSGDLKRRWQQHSHMRPWWHEVARAKLTWYPDYYRAFAVEDAVIRSETPRYNVMGHPLNGRAATSAAQRRANATHRRKKAAARFLGIRSTVSGPDSVTVKKLADLTRPLPLPPPYGYAPAKGSHSRYSTRRRPGRGARTDLIAQDALLARDVRSDGDPEGA